MSHDEVNHPSHYTAGNKIECIEVIESWRLGFHLGNAVKYLMRSPYKENAITDIRKAIWYLERYQNHVLPYKETPSHKDLLSPGISDVAVCRDWKIESEALRRILGGIYLASLTHSPESYIHMLVREAKQYLEEKEDETQEIIL